MAYKLNDVLFPIGLIIALLGNRFMSDASALQMTVIAGLLIGAMNVTTAEKGRFLLATATLSIIGVSAILTLPIVGTVIGTFVRSMVALVAPAAMIVAIVEIVPIMRQK